ncbi:MAG: DMT family transporter [Rhodobacteraceae bacterium]|nr:DMT family transporter [Paracoccaceae bacterium]
MELDVHDFGKWLALLSAVAFSFASLSVSKTKRSGGDKGVMFSVLVTLVISFAIWVIWGGSFQMGPEMLRGVMWFVLAGLFAMVLGRSLLFTSIRQLGVLRSSALKRLNPVFAILLAYFLLGERFSQLDVVGMVAIVLGFSLLIYDGFSRRTAEGPDSTPGVSAYMVGVLAALAYASAYVTRKLGLTMMDSASLGTFVSAASGFLFFGALAMFPTRYRGHFRNIFRNLDVWIVASAVSMSVGQILLFAALAYEDVSTVVMISSLEVFVSFFLALVVFRSESVPSPIVFIAALLAVFGVILVVV